MKHEPRALGGVARIVENGQLDLAPVDEPGLAVGKLLVAVAVPLLVDVLGPELVALDAVERLAGIPPGERHRAADLDGFRGAGRRQDSRRRQGAEAGKRTSGRILQELASRDRALGHFCSSLFGALGPSRFAGHTQRDFERGPHELTISHAAIQTPGGSLRPARWIREAGTRYEEE